MSFTDEIKRFAVYTKGVTADTHRETCVALFGAVIHDSPVGNPELWKSQQHKPIKDRKGPPGYTGGRFRANWICTLHHPAIGTVDWLDLENVAAMESTVAQAQGDDTVFLVNNLPYAEPLENGHSRQAPQGMVKRNVVRFQAIVQQALAEAKRQN